MTTVRTTLRRALGTLVVTGLAATMAPAAARADGAEPVWVDFDAPLATQTTYAWGGFFDATSMYDVSASAPTVRFTFPVDTDADPASATLGMSLSTLPGDCVTTGTSALRMEGWTLVLDPAAMAASLTGTCVAANAGAGYNIWVDATGRRDTVRLSVEVRLVPDSSTTSVALVPIWPTFDRRSYVPVPARASGGTLLRLRGIGLDFANDAGKPNAELLDSDGRVLSTLTDEVSLPAAWSEVDIQLPAVLPVGTTDVRIQTQTWGGPLHAIRVPFVAPLADPVAAYVTSVYANLFRRPPDPTGLAGWTAALRQGIPYSAVSDAITSSSEFRSRLVRSAYDQYLHRAPDPAGLASWLAAMNAGMRIQQMEAGFLASDESYAQAGGTDAAWISSLYRAVLGRGPSPAEVASWLGALARGAGRYDVALGFTMSAEHLSSVVDGYYVAYLGRHGESAGVRGWVASLQGGARAEQIVAGILASQEFRGRVPREAATPPVGLRP